MVTATTEDDEAVVGDECHILSPHENGPRHDSSYPQDKLDSYENLILLCRIHHKAVDDQAATYTADKLRQTKMIHEGWISERLTYKPELLPLRRRRIKQNIPSFLFRLMTGKQIFDLMGNCDAFISNHDELSSPEEVNLVGDFLQTLKDTRDLKDDLEPSDWVRTEFSVTQSLRELEQAGFYVFGAREVQQIVGGLQPEPSDFPIAIISILRSDRQEIIKINSNYVIKIGEQRTLPNDKQKA